MIPELTNEGVLPLGRFSTSIEDVEARFVPADNERRQELWKQWKHLTRLVHAVVGVLPAVWLGGSFLSSKTLPNDIDTVYILKRDDMLRLKEDQAKVFNLIQTRQLDIGVDRVEPFFLFVEEVQGSGISGNYGPATGYLMLRGYWDQLWSRSRADVAQSYPSHGYLEVIIDGYQ